MGLQVWMPLNGNINNQGLSNAIVNNNGATINTAGKIGSCYAFDGNDDLISIDCSDLYSIFVGGTQEFSICCWIYQADATRAIVFGDYGLSGGIGLNIELTTAHNIRFYWNGTPDKNFSVGVGQETWTHITITYDGSQLQIYKNGTIQSDSWSGTLAARNKTSGLFYLGRDNRTGTTALNGRLNDFRIYDHALSPREVKEISKGLVLHYPLSDPFLENTTNLLPSDIQNFNCTNIDPKSFIYNTSQHGEYTLSGYITRNPTTDGTWERPRISLLASYDSGSDAIVQDWNSLIDDGKERFINLTITTDSSRTLTKIYGWILDHSSGTTGSKNTIGRNMQLEFKDHATPYTSSTRNENIVYDTSGFCNNGTANGMFNLSSDTPRYNTSTVFNGTDNCIQFPFNDFCTNGDIFTMNIWWKKTALGSKAYETLIGGPSGFEMDTRSGAAQALSLYMATTRGGNVYSPFNMNEWYMVTLVNDGTNELYYVNGVLVNTIEKKNMPSGNYYVGAWKNETGQNFNGFMSDFRFYKTALSADDILELYHTPISLSNNGALLTQGEYVES